MDTITLLDKEGQHTIHLAEIDAPEKDQFYGYKAKEALSALVYGKQVIVIVHSTDRCGYKVGHVFAGGMSVNQQMVGDGHAWVVRKHLDNPRLLDAEDHARNAGLGLWASPDPYRIAPWQWRGKEHPKETRALVDSPVIANKLTGFYHYQVPGC